MAITHAVGSRNAAADAVVDRIDAGTTNATGQLIYMTSADAEVATLNFANPAFGAAASGAATSNAITRDESATGGTIAKFKTVDRDGNTVYEGSVTATSGGGDIELSSLTITAGEPVETDPITYTAPN